MAVIAVMALLWLVPSVAKAAFNLPSDSELEKDSLTVSLITCYPGSEIYELCGHEALRIRGEGIDFVWNYGIFDFRQPNFVYRFVKGETDYMVDSYPFIYFMPEYIERGSKVVEQDLNLTQKEARQLLSVLREETKPENKYYRYNYIKNNCATKILDRLEENLGKENIDIIYPDSIKYGSFRREMRVYHRNYPWYQFGIDLALGSGLDRDVRARDEMFVPVELERNIASAHLSDGRNLVSATRVLNEGMPSATLGPTPWYLGPMAVMTAVLVLVLILCAFELWKGRIVRWANAVWFIVIGTVGMLSVFLLFFSSHEATSPNLIAIWMNPLQYLMAAGIIWRSCAILSRMMGWYNIVSIGVLGIIWPFQTQSANPAIFPVMAAMMALSLTYTIIIGKTSYNNNAPSPKTRMVGGNVRRTTRGKRKNKK